MHDFRDTAAATAHELEDELTDFLNGDPAHVQPASVARKATTWPRQHPGCLTGATAIGLGPAVAGSGNNTSKVWARRDWW